MLDKLLVSSLAISLFTQNVLAQQRTLSETEMRTRVDSFVSAQVAADAFSGTVLHARNGRIVYERAAGFTDRERGAPINLDTKLQIASATKLYTHIAIRQLEQAGKLSLADTVGKFLPKYPNPTVRANVTIEQLLRHRSGLGSFWNAEYMARRSEIRTVKDYLELFQNDSLLFEPGTSETYSNGGYVILGAIIEKVSGKTYHDYLRAHIFEPAGMTNTMPRDNRISYKNAAIGYTRQPGGGPPPSADVRLAGPGQPRPGYGAPAPSASPPGGARVRLVGPGGREMSPEEIREERARRANTPRRPNTEFAAGLNSPAGDHFSTVGDFLKLANALLSHRLLDSARTRALLGTRYASGTDFRANGGGPGVNAEFSIYPSGDVLVVLSNYDPPAATDVAEYVRSLLIGAPGAPLAPQAHRDTSLRALVQRVVSSVAALAERNYVFPDTGRMVAEHLRKRLADGAYASVTEPGQLADKLSRDMQAVNGDRHLYVSYAGAGGGASPADGAAAGPRTVMRRPGDQLAPDVLASARRANYDFQSVQRLDGNVGYLSLSALRSRGSTEAYAVIDAAMAFLERTDALIIDLRRTIGGEPRMSDYLASYFFGPTPVPTLTSYSRGMNLTDERTTIPVKGALRPHVPLYLLVGSGTASGTEDFAFIMKQTGRGLLVGGRTAGAGRLTRMFPAGDGFVASISGGRTFDPRTGKEWERTGIVPDVAASDDGALTAAHAMALERLASAADTIEKAALLWTRAAIVARANPPRVAAETLEEYAGDYDVRRVRYEGGKLWYQRDGARPREELTPVDERSFVLGEATRVEFIRTGQRVTAMKMVNPLGQASTFPRTR